MTSVYTWWKEGLPSLEQYRAVKRAALGKPPQINFYLDRRSFLGTMAPVDKITERLLKQQGTAFAQSEALPPAHTGD
jgi:hypothetical protein